MLKMKNIMFKQHDQWRSNVNNGFETASDREALVILEAKIEKTEVHIDRWNS